MENSKKRDYQIVETFYSLQGEGRNAGVPSMFVRFFGCNLKCDFCDEPLHKDKTKIFMQHSEAIAMAKMLELERRKLAMTNCEAPSCIVFTGGEPSLYDINALVEAWKGMTATNLHFSVETNGFQLENVSECNLITLSPKSPSFIRELDYLNSLVKRKAVDIDVKLVASPHVGTVTRLRLLSKSELSRAFKSLAISSGDRLHLYLSPCNGMTEIDQESVEWCIDFILKTPTIQGVPTRLSVQQHKQWGVR